MVIYKPFNKDLKLFRSKKNKRAYRANLKKQGIIPTSVFNSVPKKSGRMTKKRLRKIRIAENHANKRKIEKWVAFFVVMRQFNLEILMDDHLMRQIFLCSFIKILFFLF